MSFSKLSKFIDVSLNNQNTVYNFIFFNLNYEKKKKKKKTKSPLAKKGWRATPCQIWNQKEAQHGVRCLYAQLYHTYGNLSIEY
jgi:hypothetical protein